MADTTARQKHHDLLHGTLDDAEYGNAAARQQYLDDAVDELTKNVGTEALRSVLQSKGSPDEQFRTLKIMEAYTQLMADKRDPRSLSDEEMDIVLRAHAEFDAAWQESPAPLRKFIYVDDAHAQLAGTPKRITTGGSVGDARNTADGMDLTQVSEVLGLDYSGSDYYVDGKVRADRQHFFFIDMPREYDDGSTVSSIGDARIPLHPMLIARAKDSTDPMVQALIEDDRLLEKDIYKDGQSKWEKTLDPSHPEYGKKSETNPYNALGGTAVSQPTEDLKKPTILATTPLSNHQPRVGCQYAGEGVCRDSMVAPKCGRAWRTGPLSKSLRWFGMKQASRTTARSTRNDPGLGYGGWPRDR